MAEPVLHPDDDGLPPESRPGAMLWAQASAAVRADAADVEGRRAKLADLEAAFAAHADESLDLARESHPVAAEAWAGDREPRQDPGWWDRVCAEAGRVLVPFNGDDDSGALFEWHHCDRCRSAPGPCACTGRSWPSEAVQAAMRVAYDAGLCAANSAITWNTTCLGCADSLDGLYAERCAGYAEREAELVGTDDEPGLLDGYFVTTSSGVVPGRSMVVWVCRRCPGGHVHVVARDLDGDQSDLTLGELVEGALVHEREQHPGSAPAVVTCGSDALLLPPDAGTPVPQAEGGEDGG